MLCLFRVLQCLLPPTAVRVWIICELRVASYELRVDSCECELRVTSCECELRVESCELKSASCELESAS